MNNDLISRSELKKEFEKVYPLSTNEMGVVVNKRIYDIIDNAPAVYDNPYSDGREDGYIEGYEEAKRECEPQDERVDISKLRLMSVEECAGHTIDYAMGWKACIEWIKGGAE